MTRAIKHREDTFIKNIRIFYYSLWIVSYEINLLVENAGRFLLESACYKRFILCTDILYKLRKRNFGDLVQDINYV